MFQFTLPTVLKNITDNEIINYSLFGEFTITSNLLMLYKTVLNTTLEKNKNELEIEDVHLEIIKQISLGCYILVNVIILELGDSPNCDINVHNSYEMYHKDLSIGNDDHLYIACDQAIFGRLIFYKEKHSEA
ncbi:12824_t:CDS:1 [Cetraspora pellucida]|uniref:12824_t:CDS:1 n=1 Tax=Cetraspora pellucida TaxID=1433469 RepID=A0A9N9JFK1_9GLOM|nr:12824_t:CDS:1 [Cetraspora pellucida]